jgi:DNA-binding transcriptional LysR family regulator
LVVVILSTHKYETFLKIVELGNITKASVELGYSQSAISHVVSSLENELNLKLLIRDRQGVRLTREGEEVLPAIQRIVQEKKNLLNQIASLQNLESGSIHVGAFISALLHFVPGLIKSFTERYPNIQFVVSHGGYQDIEEQIYEGKIDCGFVCLPTSLGIETIPLFKDRLLAIFPEGTRPEQERFPIEDIEKESIIMQKEMEYEVLDMLKGYQLNADIKYSSDFEYSMLPMVVNGLGMCILPELLLQDAPYKLTIKELEPPAFRTIGIGYRKDYCSPAARRFIDHVKEHIGSPELQE